MSASITILGLGSWGTALAIQAARAGTVVRLWGRDASIADAIQRSRFNSRYLPDARLPDSIEVLYDWERAIAGATDVLIAVPSHAFRAVVERLAADMVGQTLRLSWATKGLELDTGLLPHQVVGELLPTCSEYAVLSGPTFAREVGAGLPTAITVASPGTTHADRLVQQLSDTHFRVYTSADIVGVEVGGAVKNVLAIGAGLSDGLGYGANARVALINRGLREMMRFGLAMGGSADTFMGLACMGDLVLTCTDDQSRNRRMGLALASGRTMADAQSDIGQVVEGVMAARAVYRRALDLSVEMPIVEQIHRVLFDGVAPRDAVQALLSRVPGTETN